MVCFPKYLGFKCCSYQARSGHIDKTAQATAVSLKIAPRHVSAVFFIIIWNSQHSALAHGHDCAPLQGFSRLGAVSLGCAVDPLRIQTSYRIVTSKGPFAYLTLFSRRCQFREENSASKKKRLSNASPCSAMSALVHVRVRVTYPLTKHDSLLVSCLTHKQTCWNWSTKKHINWKSCLIVSLTVRREINVGILEARKSQWKHFVELRLMLSSFPCGTQIGDKVTTRLGISNEATLAEMF